MSKSFIDIYREILPQSKFVFFSNIFERVSSFLLLYLIAKLFPVEDYGNIVNVFAISNISLLLFHFGLPIYLQRQIAKNENVQNDIVSIFTIKLFTIVPYYLILVLYFCYSQISFSIYYIMIISISAFMFDVNNIFNHLYYGKSRFDIYFKSIFVSRSALCLLAFIFWYYEMSLIYFISLYLIAPFLQSLILFKNLGTVQRVNFRLKLSFQMLKRIIFVSAPLGLTMFCNFLYDKVDIVLIANYIGQSAVAEYNIAYSFYKLSGLLFGMVLIPSFTLFAKNNASKGRLNKNFFFVGAIILVMSFLLYIFFYYFGAVVIDMFFQEKYANSKMIIPYLAIAVIAVGLNNFTGVFLNANARYQQTMFSAIVGLIINVIINSIYLEKLGILAAVYSTIIAEYIILLIQIYFIYKLYSYKT